MVFVLSGLTRYVRIDPFKRIKSERDVRVKVEILPPISAIYFCRLLISYDKAVDIFLFTSTPDIIINYGK